MPLKIQTAELLELMRDFYTLTGIRFVLFDENYREILSYPAAGTPFCSCLRQNPDFDRKCRESDRLSFETCRTTKTLTIFTCHAGLVEATAPLFENGTIIGYIMFGQIAERQKRDSLLAELTACCAAYADEKAVAELLPKIKFKEKKQIAAAAKILDACTSYILLKEMVKPSKKHLLLRMEQYLSLHLSEEITVETLCRALGVSRTRLYEAVKPSVQGGIAQWIREKRMERAKCLLRETEKTIVDISGEVGFSDYNYFLRVFRKTYGLSPKEYRRSQK